MLPFYSFPIFAETIALTISKDKLNIEKIKLHFKGKKSFETKDVIVFYREDEPKIKPTTVNWRVHNLVQSGVLSRIGRGVFTIGEGKVNFIPEISVKLKKLNTKLKKQFPFLKICLWDTSVINEFMIHQPGKFYLMVEVEKEASESVFYFLKDSKSNVFLEPSADIINKYVSNEKDVVIVTSLVSEAPTQNIKDISTITLEKMLVDIFCDTIIFNAQQGSEMKTIFEVAFKKYTINESRIFRYADRRRKKESFDAYLKNKIVGSK